jgi:hypothetical protein
MRELREEMLSRVEDREVPDTGRNVSDESRTTGTGVRAGRPQWERSGREELGSTGSSDDPRSVREVLECSRSLS